MVLISDVCAPNRNVMAPTSVFLFLLLLLAMFATVRGADSREAGFEGGDGEGGGHRHHQHHHHDRTPAPPVRSAAEQRAYNSELLRKQARDTHDDLYTLTGSYTKMAWGALALLITPLIMLFVLICLCKPILSSFATFFWLLQILLYAVLFLPRWLLNKLLCCGSLPGPGQSASARSGLERMNAANSDSYVSANEVVAAADTCVSKACTNRRCTFRNASKRSIASPLCAQHQAQMLGPVAFALREFETPPTYHVCAFRTPGNQNEHTNEEPQSVLEEANSCAKEVAESGVTDPGILFIYTSPDDDRPKGATSESKLAHEGGLDAPASLFRVDCAKDYYEAVKQVTSKKSFAAKNTTARQIPHWKCSNASLARVLLQDDAFARQHFVRFNASTNEYERGWFFMNKAKFISTLTDVVHAIDINQPDIIPRLVAQSTMQSQ